MYNPVKQNEDDEAESSYTGNDSIWGTIAGLMETFGVSKDHILWSDSWINWTLLMRDKLRYNPKKDGEGKNKDVAKKITDPNEATRSLMQLTKR